MNGSERHLNAHIAYKRLNGIKLLDSKIDANLSVLRQLKTRLSYLPSWQATEKVSRTSDINASFTKIIDKVVFLENKINEDVDRLFDLKTEILSELDKLTEPKFYNILYKKFFEYKTLDNIANEMCYSVDWVKHNVLPALIEYSKFISLH